MLKFFANKKLYIAFRMRYTALATDENGLRSGLNQTANIQ